MPVILYAVGLALAALAVRIYLLGSKKALINWVANSSLFYIMYKRQLAAHHASPEFNVTCFETTILDGAATVLTIPFLQDNFAYILFDHATGECAAVDVADPQAVLDMWRALVARRSSPSLPLNLKYILTTHKHFDHAGGNRKLKAVLPNATIVGGVLDNVLGSTKQAWHGDKLNVGSLTIETLAVPCHTMGHVAYYVSTANHTGQGCVFTGDTLFVGGTGRFFEGNGDQMYRNLYQVLGSLPPSTQVFCGHEYTLNNLSFASYIEPDNVDVQAKACAFSSASRAVLDIVVVSCR
ncbi:hydroxyacylglutathione hydrolase [Aphanomyces invadans]|uniref:hydroxyacylglutathione hydrolase n=1 Tax=Aphanomyces invadans TaxID=157072 RepID=A0A024U0R8_9STRA|nr:hydroxyacylglutathione hydrolase [Aphanomyces invadans]ETV99814.1 hydroxyacylglutathione hydrolase [Aphanomyces invadans]|eukprot:XP_008871590.1 hydroxyacylglutathione hydrolase [Aphanomyces invadans]